MTNFSSLCLDSRLPRWIDAHSTPLFFVFASSIFFSSFFSSPNPLLYCVHGFSDTSLFVIGSSFEEVLITERTSELDSVLEPCSGYGKWVQMAFLSIHRRVWAASFLCVASSLFRPVFRHHISPCAKEFFFSVTRTRVNGQSKVVVCLWSRVITRHWNYLLVT